MTANSLLLSTNLTSYRLFKTDWLHRGAGNLASAAGADIRGEA